MPTINDYKKSALKTAGYTGDIDTAEKHWLESLTTPYKGPIPNLWMKYLGGLGFDGPLPTRQYNYLGSLGYTGSLNNRWYQYWKTGIVTPETAALVARFTTPPTPTRVGLINTLISSLKTAGVWSKLDAFYMLAAADSQAARQNWIADQYNLTAIGGPTFTADRGYAGDGASSYLATGAVRNGLSKFTQDSACLGAWERSEVTAGFLVGTATGAIARIQGRIGGASGGRLNSATGAAAVVASSIGLTVMDRPSSGTVRCLRNGVQNGTSASTSTALTADAMYLLRDAGTYHAGQEALAYIGSALSDAEHLAAYNASLTYLQAVGAA